MAMLLKAEIRDRKNCSSLRQLRKNGRIPGVLYGADGANENIHIDQSEFLQALKQHGKSSVIQLDLGNRQSENVMIAEIQKDDLKGNILHLDFKRVNMDKPITTMVPITLIGEAAGVKQGGIMQFQTRELEIRCLPSLIPDSLPLYVSELDMGGSLTVQDLEIPEGVEVQHEMDEVIVSITAPRMKPVEEDGEEEIAEPEVVGAKDGPGLDEAK